MDVPGAFVGGVEGVWAQYLAVCGDDEGVVRGYLPGDLRYAGGLAQGEAKVAGELRHGRRLRPAAPAFAGIGLRDDEAHLVVGGDEAAQDGGGEIRGAGEGYLQGMAGLALSEQALAHLAHGDLAGLAIGAVQDQDAVEVVDLVLQDPREQAGGL